MAKNAPQRSPTPAITKQLTVEEMRRAILRIERRVSELSKFDASKIRKSGEPEIVALQKSIESTLEEIFGSESTQFHRYKEAARLDLTNYMALLNSGNANDVYEIQQGVRNGVARAISILRQLIGLFIENLEEVGETKAGRALRAYDGLDLHSEIERAAGDLYRGGHYANAIEDAVKALNGLVRFRADLTLDGMPLVEMAFSPKNPVLKFNELSDESDLNEQKGFMMLFAGAVAGLRNPRAHKLIKDDPERALEFIAFVSLLAKLLDSARKSR